MNEQILELLKQNNILLRQILAILTDDNKNFATNIIANFIADKIMQK